MPMYYIVSMQFIWASSLLHRQYRYKHIMEISISIGELESYLTSSIGAMQRVLMKKYGFLAYIYLAMGDLLLTSNEETDGKLMATVVIWEGTKNQFSRVERSPPSRIKEK